MNFRLLQELLTPRNDRHGFVAVLDALTRLIYAEIDAYVALLRCAIADAFTTRAPLVNQLPPLNVYSMMPVVAAGFVPAPAVVGAGDSAGHDPTSARSRCGDDCGVFVLYDVYALIHDISRSTQWRRQ
jgi:hypothetical protein